jgi:branched-chain amino acid transport system substrate-binding protein
MTGCSHRAPILIGLAVELTGKQSDVGINIRDAAQLAVDTVNARGGVNGRPLKLLIRDDEGKPEVARQVDAELVKENVVAIIGHYTSGQTAAVYDQMNQARVVLISPSTTSTDFTGQDDYFFRLMPDNSFFSSAFANYIYNKRGARRLAGAYDLNNRSYTETFWRTAQAEFERLGGDASTEFTFKSGETDLKALMLQVTNSGADAFLIVASAVDMAVMAQYIRQAGSNIPFFAATWAQTAQLVEKGGTAVDELEICTTTNPNDQSMAYKDFLQRFEQRFGRSPLLATTQSYETVLVLARALEMTNGKAEGLPAALTAIQDFPGIQGTISFDHYGDVSRNVFIVQINDGKYRTIEIISPARK